MLPSILAITLFFVIYAGLHSLLASRPVKNWARQALGPGTERWYRLAYNIFAGVTLLPLFPMLALLPDRMLYVAPAPWRWLLATGQLAALAGLGLAFLQTNPWHFLGLAQLLAPPSDVNGSLVVRGLYCRVRHPLYFFSLLLLWLTPAMTVNLLATYLLFTLYFYIGSIFEERRLVAEFGPAYREYQRLVPRLIPRPGRCYQETERPGVSL
ncbi:MAG: isoprenylcysteine carboxylmethyltransferase family protein [Chloroflexota bacterium]